MVTDEEAEKIKEHLMEQLENFPEEKREQIKNQINSMSNDQIEQFIEQNKLTHLGGQCIFCSIIANQTPSYKIAETQDDLAILELNPLSQGHSLVIPKEHLEKITPSTKELAQDLALELEKKLSPKEIQINELKIMDHALLEVIPIYGKETQRKKASEEELKSTQEKILKEEEIKPLPTSEKETIPILKPRIPN